MGAIVDVDFGRVSGGGSDRQSQFDYPDGHRDLSSTQMSNVVVGRNPDILPVICNKDVSLAIWERDLPAAISKLSLVGKANIRLQTALEGLPYALAAHLENAGFANVIEHDMLLGDILNLAHRFAKVMELSDIQIRLDHITNNACKKFHADYVTARLICTYVGQGTQYYEGNDTTDCNCGEAHKIRQLRSGDVALLKGRLWSADAPAIHRSPPIEGTGEERLVLVINACASD